MEQRGIHRVSEKIIAQFGLHYPDYDGEAVNLSPGGLLIRSTVRYPPETPLVVELQFPRHGTTLVRGVVVRIEKFEGEETEDVGMGIDLSHVSEEYLLYLKTFYLPPSKGPSGPV
jgi:hypothetical protein